MSVEQNVKDSVAHITLPVLPSFNASPVSQSVCVLIISLAQADGFGVSLVYCKRRPWFTEKAPTLSEKGNIMVRYRKISVAQIRRKFTEAETLVKSLFDTRLHKPNEDGVDEALPLFDPLFFLIF